MDCTEAEQLIQDELDGLLTPDRETELRVHLDGCVACCRARRELQRLGTAMGRLEDSPLPDKTWDALVSRAMAQRGRAPVHAGWRTVLAGLAAATALVLAAFWLGGMARESPAPRELIPVPTSTLQRPIGDVAFSRAAARAHASARSAKGPEARVAASPQHGGSARRARSRRPSSFHVAAASPSATPPSNQGVEGEKTGPIELTGHDLGIYERAIEFADMPGLHTPPTETLLLARMQATSGDIDDAIKTYEEAVRESLCRAATPLPGPFGYAAMGPVGSTPLPPPELVARMPARTAEIEPYVLACLLGGE